MSEVRGEDARVAGPAALFGDGSPGGDRGGGDGRDGAEDGGGRAGRRSVIDPGWLFIVSGAVLISATVLIPAADDLAEAEQRRDHARALARHAAERVERYSLYLDAVEQRDRTVMLSLAASQLNLAPDSTPPLAGALDASFADASVVGHLDPAFETPALGGRPDSLLRRLAIDDGMRLVLFGVGGVCILYGLLPPAVSSSNRGEGLAGRVRRGAARGYDVSSAAASPAP